MSTRLLSAGSSTKAFADAPAEIQKAFLKQVTFLALNLHHPSLHAKKYDEAQNRWQARVNRNWRFYFTIEGDVYVILDIIPHQNDPCKLNLAKPAAFVGQIVKLIVNLPHGCGSNSSAQRRFSRRRHCRFRMTAPFFTVHRELHKRASIFLADPRLNRRTAA